MSPAAVPAKRRHPLIRLLRSIGITLGLAYLLVVVGMMVAQRQLLYFKRDQDGALAAAKGVAIPGSEIVKITTTDGQTLSGWYVRPSSANAPVFLFLHGQGGGLIYQVTRWARIRAMGAGVLAIAYRGYPGSTGSPTEAGLAIDARAAYAWLSNKHPPSHIVIHGHSLGTGVATELAVTAKARALVLEAPFTAAVDVAGERYPFLPVSLLMFDQFRSRDRAPKITTPTLVVHGDDDRVIPIHHGQRLAELFAGPKQFVRVRGGGHNSLSRDGLYDHIATFLARQPFAR